MRYFELFAGIGGFSLGISRGVGVKSADEESRQAEPSVFIRGERPSVEEGRGVLPTNNWGGGAVCVGYSEIDKYADAIFQYHHKGVKNYGDIANINVRQLPDFDLLTFGSPCQDFSIAGKRLGLDGQRSSLVGRAIEIVRAKRPRFFIWENVKGAFSSNNGADFWAIIKAFADIGGYRLEWQLLNTSWFLPQNRERIYLVGHLGGGCGREVFPIGENGRGLDETEPKLQREIQANQREGCEGDLLDSEIPQDGSDRHLHNRLKKVGGKDSQSYRVYDTGGISQTLAGEAGGLGAKTGLYPDGKRIRRLTPTECERLQGFPDGWTSKGIMNGEVVEISDTQRYKCLGNAVSVPVVAEVIKRLSGEPE